MLKLKDVLKKIVKAHVDAEEDPEKRKPEPRPDNHTISVLFKAGATVEDLSILYPRKSKGSLSAIKAHVTMGHKFDK